MSKLNKSLILYSLLQLLALIMTMGETSSVWLLKLKTSHVSIAVPDSVAPLWRHIGQISPEKSTRVSAAARWRLGLKSKWVLKIASTAVISASFVFLSKSHCTSYWRRLRCLFVTRPSRLQLAIIHTALLSLHFNACCVCFIHTMLHKSVSRHTCKIADCWKQNPVCVCVSVLAFATYWYQKYSFHEQIEDISAKWGNFGCSSKMQRTAWGLRIGFMGLVLGQGVC